MPDGPELRTGRLLLRRWRDADRDGFAELNADCEVMEHFPKLLPREESDALVDHIEASFEERGFGFWAVELVASSEFIGFTGLALAEFEAHFTPAVEVGWRVGVPVVGWPAAEGPSWQQAATRRRPTPLPAPQVAAHRLLEAFQNCLDGCVDRAGRQGHQGD